MILSHVGGDLAHCRTTSGGFCISQLAYYLIWRPNLNE